MRIHLFISRAAHVVFIAVILTSLALAIGANMAGSVSIEYPFTIVGVWVLFGILSLAYLRLKHVADQEG